MDGKELVELSYDIQIGLGRLDVAEFEEIRTIGMAATLAMHIRGLGEIEYQVLRKVSDYYFNIPSYGLKEVIRLLQEIGFIEVVEVGSKIKSIIPQVPRFQDIYTHVGQCFQFSDLNEHEQGTLLILSSLQKHPDNKYRIQHALGVPRDLMGRCIEIGEYGNYIKPYRARGKDILASPFYFADNVEALADVTAKIGATDIKKLLDMVKENQGWPLSLIMSKLELGGCKITPFEKELLMHLCQENILKPPSLEFSDTTETFVFTPSPGASRLNSANREIYERAMALVSSVRKGQLLPDQYKIKYPVLLLRALKDRGYIRSNSEANVQYYQLVVMKIGVLHEVGAGRYQFKLIRTEENLEALDLALKLLETGNLENMEVDKNACIALSKDEKYIQSVISAAELKQRQKTVVNPEVLEQFEQLILSYD